VLDFKITTATFGGGVIAGTPDRLTPVRATEVRGILRFWWRASRGSNFETPQDLLAAESEVWGSTDSASPIQIEILDARLGVETQSMVRDGGRTVPAEPKYALFPAQSKDSLTRDYRPIYRGGSFRLKIRCAEKLKADLEAALRYWTNFGGIGSRTR